jgi:sensor histidine kinase YesM
LQLGAFNGLFAVGLWAVALFGPRAVSDASAREIEARELRTAAELARFRANLQPHFLLDTLTTIAGLVALDPRGAREVLGALGDLLRDSLEEVDEMQTLEREVAWLRRYAEILEMRHRGSLRFQWEIAPETRALWVPRQLLQPLWRTR